MAKALAGVGASVAVLGREDDTSSAAATQSEALGGVAYAVVGDAADISDQRRVLDEVIDRFGPARHPR
jgi:NAD(P)-dependent dehydrogenase (short-subunit alcohol dehydrogenase family)